ncbi:hypothetical protein LY78DRAFT_211138 [Colletotrichum sublineola]|nr:hypothetical protein LY78DRAFT_211138 [Colletotrichum sublineola]
MTFPLRSVAPTTHTHTHTHTLSLSHTHSHSHTLTAKQNVLDEAAHFSHVMTGLRAGSFSQHDPICQPPETPIHDQTCLISNRR